jgi:hypothetical protein
VNSTQCIDDFFTLIKKECILIELEEPICQGVVKGCENNSIDSKITCETHGAVVDDSNTPLPCMWLEGNTTQNVNQSCKLKVLLFFFYLNMI